MQAERPKPAAVPFSTRADEFRGRGLRTDLHRSPFLSTEQPLARPHLIWAQLGIPQGPGELIRRPGRKKPGIDTMKNGMPRLSVPLPACTKHATNRFYTAATNHLGALLPRALGRADPGLVGRLSAGRQPPATAHAPKVAEAAAVPILTVTPNLTPVPNFTPTLSLAPLLPLCSVPGSRAVSSTRSPSILVAAPTGCWGIMKTRPVTPRSDWRATQGVFQMQRNGGKVHATLLAHHATGIPFNGTECAPGAWRALALFAEPAGYRPLHTVTRWEEVRGVPPDYFLWPPSEFSGASPGLDTVWVASASARIGP